MPLKWLFLFAQSARPTIQCIYSSKGKCKLWKV